MHCALHCTVFTSLYVDDDDVDDDDDDDGDKMIMPAMEGKERERKVNVLCTLDAHTQVLYTLV